MDELDHGLALSFSGAVRDAALSRLQTQVAQWKVALPPVEPLVLDFGLGEFERCVVSIRSLVRMHAA